MDRRSVLRREGCDPLRQAVPAVISWLEKSDRLGAAGPPSGVCADRPRVRIEPWCRVGTYARDAACGGPHLLNVAAMHTAASPRGLSARERVRDAGLHLDGGKGHALAAPTEQACDGLWRRPK